MATRGSEGRGMNSPTGWRIHPHGEFCVCHVTDSSSFWEAFVVDLRVNLPRQ
ncbi:hypothetical protein GIB67_015132, partial [Kingdonia uniflora]